MLDNVRAVIFDLDGTLVDSIWIWNDIDVEFLKKRNIEFDEKIQSEIEGMSFTETAQFFNQKYSLNENVEDIKKEWIDMALDYYLNKIELRNGAKEFLNYLRENNIKIGMGTSNSIKLAESVLKRHGIFDYFETIVTSCEVKKGKPHPDVFLKAAKNLNVKEENCLVFEDTYAGTLAAKRANMRVISVKERASVQFADKIKAIANAYINDYTELELVNSSI